MKFMYIACAYLVYTLYIPCIYPVYTLYTLYIPCVYLYILCIYPWRIFIFWYRRSSEPIRRFGSNPWWFLPKYQEVFYMLFFICFWILCFLIFLHFWGYHALGPIFLKYGGQTFLEKSDFLGDFRSFGWDFRSKRSNAWYKKKFGSQSRQIRPWMPSGDRGDVKDALE